MLAEQVRAKKKRNAKRKTKRRSRLPGAGVGAKAVASGGGVLAAALAIAGGTQAYGEVIRFDNALPGEPGHFDWTDTGVEIRSYLDVTVSAAAQLGPYGPNPFIPSAFAQVREESAQYGTIIASVGAAAGLQVGGYYDYVLVGVPSGTLIPSGTEWLNFGYADWYGSKTPEGIPTYLGVRFDLGSGYHYGWIGVVRTGTLFETFAWGYETEVGVPIAAGAVPAPGTLALLAFGALAGRSRKRKDN